jgi:hypothetical protein
MISHELSAVQQNEQISAVLATQIEQFLAEGGKILDLGLMEPEPLRRRREVEPAPRASKSAAKPPQPVKEKPTTLAERQRVRRAELAPEIRELAKTLNARQIALRLGISSTTLYTIGREYGILFNPGRSGAQIAAEARDKVFADRLRAFQEIGLTESQACMRAGIGFRTFNRVCKAFDLHFPETPEAN